MIGLKWQISEKNKNYNLDLENLSDGDFNSFSFSQTNIISYKVFPKLNKILGLEVDLIAW